MEKRGQFKSKFGFIMASAGSAVGLGNLWGFPYKAGMGGGFAFILVYLIFVATLAIPIMMCEFALGRKMKSNVVSVFKKIDKRLGFVGYMGFVAAIFIFAFYSVLSGWVINYALQYGKNIVTSANTFANPGEYFGTFTANPVLPVIFYLVFIIATVVIVIQGVEKGIEKAAKVMMPVLFVCLLIIIVRSVTLPGAMAGIEFLFKPDFSKLTPQTLGLALSQMFFSCSLGMGTMMTYGSYLSDSDNLQENAIIVPILDTMAAILAGLAIFPAVFAFGIEPTQGPGLMFVSLPGIFNEMFMGDIFGFIFFVLVIFAAVTSSISMLEVPVSIISENFGLSRKKAAIIMGAIVAVWALPVALSFGKLSSVTIGGMALIDFYDFMGEYVLMTLGSLFIAIVCGWVIKMKTVKDEVEKGGKFKYIGEKYFEFVVKFVAPILIVVVMVFSISSLI